MSDCTEIADLKMANAGLRQTIADREDAAKWWRGMSHELAKLYRAEGYGITFSNADERWPEVAKVLGE